MPLVVQKERRRHSRWLVWTEINKSFGKTDMLNVVNLSEALIIYLLGVIRASLIDWMVENTNGDAKSLRHLVCITLAGSYTVVGEQFSVKSNTSNLEVPLRRSLTKLWSFVWTSEPTHRNSKYWMMPLASEVTTQEAHFACAITSCKHLQSKRFDSNRFDWSLKRIALKRCSKGNSKWTQKRDWSQASPKDLAVSRERPGKLPNLGTKQTFS